MTARTRVTLGRREDLGADCADCFGLCCVALAFTRSVDFPVDKDAGDPCVHLDTRDGCTIHPHLRDRGFRGCTVFDCFGAGQEVSRQTFAGRSWRDDSDTRTQMFAVFPVVRRLHELLWYLDEALAGAADRAVAAALRERFARVQRLADGDPASVLALDVDAEYDAARPVLLAASRALREAHGVAGDERRVGRIRVGPGADLLGADLRHADLRGASLRGALLIGAGLTEADLRHCECIGADLRDADLSGADLRDAVYLTQMQVNAARGDAARGDAATRLPTGFQRPSHWAH